MRGKRGGVQNFSTNTSSNTNQGARKAPDLAAESTVYGRVGKKNLEKKSIPP